MVVKAELVLTWTEYWIAFPLGVVDGFHAIGVEQVLAEQVLLAVCICDGADGGVALGAVSTKLPTVDHAETLLVVTESRA